MENKQIIDGIDVSECKHYNPEQYFKCNIGCCHCEENPNCYYKQLKRKEQECEELKKKKEENEKFYLTRYVNKESRCLELEHERNYYKQALEEIEKIVKQTCSRRCTNDCLGTRKHCGYGQILDIINKTKE